MKLRYRLILLMIVPLLILAAYLVNGYQEVINQIEIEVAHVGNPALKTSIDQTLDDELTSLYVIALTTVMALIFVVLLLDSLVVRPIDEFSNAVERISEGDFDVKIKKSNILELQRLSDSFNRVLVSMKLASSRRKGGK